VATKSIFTRAYPWSYRGRMSACRSVFLGLRGRQPGAEILGDHCSKKNWNSLGDICGLPKLVSCYRGSLPQLANDQQLTAYMPANEATLATPAGVLMRSS
jgi:hypothetical protein